MLFQSVISSNGPLPIQGTFNAESDAEMVIFVSGSAWSNQAGQWTGITISLDGNVIGEAAVYCNEATSHRALIPVLIPATVGFGSHTITLNPIDGFVQTDVNDFFNVSILY